MSGRYSSTDNLTKLTLISLWMSPVSYFIAPPSQLEHILSPIATLVKNDFLLSLTSSRDGEKNKPKRMTTWIHLIIGASVKDRDFFRLPTDPIPYPFMPVISDGSQDRICNRNDGRL